MSLAILLIPDFLIILFGFALNRYTDWGRNFWGGLEKLIYFVLFPALLFNSIASQQFDFLPAAAALKTVLAIVVIGIAVAFAAKWIVHPDTADSKAFASCFQTAFRFNSYIGLAIAGRLHGEAGIAAMGLMIGITVPLCNMAAVWMLARDSEMSVVKEIVKNPLILATVAGVLFSLSGLALPEVLQMFISRIGAASLACGLLAAGAALTLSNARKNAPLIAYNTSVKLIVMPVAAILLAHWLGIDGIYFDIVVLFAALPTATSAYVLAVRMGGDGAVVSQAITVSTLLGMVSIPLWLTVARMM